MLNFGNLSLKELDILIEMAKDERDQRKGDILKNKISKYNILIEELAKVSQDILEFYDELKEESEHGMSIHHDIEYFAEKPTLKIEKNNYYKIGALVLE